VLGEEGHRARSLCAERRGAAYKERESCCAKNVRSFSTAGHRTPFNCFLPGAKAPRSTSNRIPNPSLCVASSGVQKLGDLVSGAIDGARRAKEGLHLL